MAFDAPGDISEFEEETGEAGNKTLYQLSLGPNAGAAQNAIEDKVYFYKIVYNFLAWQLAASSGGRRPVIYDTENRKLLSSFFSFLLGRGLLTYPASLEECPRFKVRAAGVKPPPFIYDVLEDENSD